MTITSAFEYIQRIKKRCDPETYKEFLDILSRYHKKSAHVDDKEVLEHIGRLFKDEPDFYRDFHHFLPEISEGSEKPRMDAVVPQKRKRRDREKEREKDRDRETKSSSTHHKVLSFVLYCFLATRYRCMGLEPIQLSLSFAILRFG